MSAHTADRFASPANVLERKVVIADETTVLMKQMDTEFGAFITQLGLQQVEGLDPRWYITDWFVGEGIISADMFCSTPGMNIEVPTKETILEFYVDMDCECLDGLHADIKASLARQIKSRLVLLHKMCYKSYNTSANGAEQGEDEPLPDSSRKTLQGKELMVYGWNVGINEFPNLVVLGQISRGFTTGFHTTIELKNCRSQNEARAARGSGVLEISTNGTLKAPKKAPDIKDVFSFLFFLMKWCRGMELISLNFVATFPDWQGDEHSGVVRQVRYQWTAEHSAWYFGIWMERGSTYMAGVQGSGVGLLVKNEEAIRSKAISLCYDRHLQFGSAMIQAWDQRSNLSGYKAPAASIPFPNNKQRPPPTGATAAQQATKDAAAQVAKDGKKGLAFGPGSVGYVDGLRTSGKDFKITSGPHSGKQICKFFADGRGCNHGTGCYKAHVCDIMVQQPGGASAPCLGDHARAAHP